MNRFPVDKIVRNHPVYGGIMELKGDSSSYYFNPDQKFIPHELLPESDWYARQHPFLDCIGLQVGLQDWISSRYFGGAATGTITGIRTMKIYKSTKMTLGSHQVEILGLPTVWFGAGHIEHLN